MDLDFIYKLKEEKFWWINVVFYLAISLLISTGVLFGLFILKNSLQETKLQEIKSKIDQTGTKQQKELENEVFAQQEKINNFTVLFKEHKIPSNLFNYFENSTLPDVWFADFAIDTNSYEVKLRGQTNGFKTLSRQIDIFRKSELIGNISVLNVRMEDGNVVFDLSIPIGPALFKQSLTAKAEVPSETEPEEAETQTQTTPEESGG